MRGKMAYLAAGIATLSGFAAVGFAIYAAKTLSDVLEEDLFSVDEEVDLENEL
jgi:hypothetical protein